MNMLIRLVFLFMLFLTSQSGIATTTEFIDHQYDVNHVALNDEIYGYDNTSNLRYCCEILSDVKIQGRSFLAFVSDFLAAKKLPGEARVQPVVRALTC